MELGTVATTIICASFADDNYAFNTLDDDWYYARILAVKPYR